MSEICPEHPELSGTTTVDLTPVEVDLVELARWAALLISAALAAHRQPRQIHQWMHLLNVAGVLRRMLGQVSLPIEAPKRHRHRTRRPPGCTAR